MNIRQFNSIGFVSSDTPEAKSAEQELVALYGSTPIEEAEAIVALGGDGMMLQCLHKFMDSSKPIYGMNRGSVGFLMNEFRTDNLIERLQKSDLRTIHPLRLQAVNQKGDDYTARAINEVSLLRQSHQAAKLRITVDGKTRMEELSCDGALVSTPAGSTAYNLSAHGPILPIDSRLLALTPISAFRPRRWRGALLPNHSTVEIDVLESEKRPVSVAADHVEFRNIDHVTIFEDPTSECLIMFDRDHNWDERILSEMFKY